MSERDAEPTAGRELPPTLASGGPSGSADGDLVGRVLGGRYRILRKLGEGAMGAVYLGEHLKIGRKDAIKVLRDSLATDADTIARFVRGTRNVSMIRHPNICTIYDYSDTADGIQFVAMELVPGETLRDLLQREGRLSVEVAVHIARQAAEALDAAHEVGIVHRDLKPANIMVVPGRSGALDVKVVDFDIAKGSADGEGEEVTRMGFVVGTPEYMSPEQLIGDRLDGRSDIYSLALVLYRMLTGTLPFTAQDTQDLMVKRLTEEPMSLEAGLPGTAFPPGLERALRRALQRKPAERQATAAEFAREIAAAASAAPVAEGPPAAAATAGVRPSDGPGGGGRERRPLPMAARAGAGVAALLAAGIVGFIAWGGGGDGGDEVPTDRLTQSATPIVEYSDPGATMPDSFAASATGDPDPQPPATSEVRSDPPRTDATDVGGTADPPAPQPSRPPPPSVGELLDMLEQLGVDPDRATLLSTRDAAIEAWDHPEASDQVRATAAYVAYSAVFALGDRQQALTWIERALRLRPDYQPYVLARDGLLAPAGGY